ncbi:hypothetical protein TNCV_1193531 [Trichonephila clavipes]|nr:hypothetical protein TNCV_1193531 [Trichonephila clavipes]
MAPLRDSLREILYSPDAPRIAELLEGFWRRISRPLEPWSSAEDDTLADTLSLNFHTTPTGGRLSLDRFNMHRP